jgi:hypothetical protein
LRLDWNHNGSDNEGGNEKDGFDSAVHSEACVVRSRIEKKGDCELFVFRWGNLWELIFVRSMMDHLQASQSFTSKITLGCHTLQLPGASWAYSQVKRYLHDSGQKTLCYSMLLLTSLLSSTQSYSFGYLLLVAAQQSLTVSFEHLLM